MKDDEKKGEVCPQCGAPMGEITSTPSGRQLQRCSKGSWNEETKKVEGCPHVRWLAVPEQTLDEKCPKCKAPLVLKVTRFNKKMKKCSTNTWDPATQTASGCDYIEWIGGPTTEQLEEDCPKCGEKLVMMTTSAGKKLKKCSTNKWDRNSRMAVGCDFVEWQ